MTSEQHIVLLQRIIIEAANEGGADARISIRQALGHHWPDDMTPADFMGPEWPPRPIDPDEIDREALMNITKRHQTN